jgi:hypothetical protein
VANLLTRGEWGGLAFVDVTPDVVDYVASNMHPADVAEVQATSGSDNGHALRMACAASTDAVAAVSAYGEPLAIFGVGTLSLLYNTGSPWMLRAAGASRYRRALIEGGRSYTGEMLQHFDVLVNHVDARNLTSVAWLQRLGFLIEPPKPYGIRGLPFHRFSIER